MLPTKFRVNWPFSSGEEVKNGFSRWNHGSHLGFPIRTILAIFDLRGSCKTFCHWVRITAVLRFIKHIFITNLQSIPTLLKHISVTFLPSCEKQINSLLLVSVGDTEK